jgi:hypothetical protein
VTAATPVHDTLARLIAAATGPSRVPLGQAAVCQPVRSLEVRWIFPGPLTAAVAGWFARFPARTQSRQDTYLLDPPLPGVSVKVRGGGPVEVKVYRGSPGTLDVASRARGRLEAWQKWSLALRPPGPGSSPWPSHLPLSSHRGDAGLRAAAIWSPGREEGMSQRQSPILCEQEVTS